MTHLCAVADIILVGSMLRLWYIGSDLHDLTEFRSAFSLLILILVSFLLVSVYCYIIFAISVPQVRSLSSITSAFFSMIVLFFYLLDLKVLCSYIFIIDSDAQYMLLRTPLKDVSLTSAKGKFLKSLLPIFPFLCSPATPLIEVKV